MHFTHQNMHEKNKTKVPIVFNGNTPHSSHLRCVKKSVCFLLLQRMLNATGAWMQIRLIGWG